ncbi:MAG: hypothetical protein ACLQGP_25675 [Isosphaeraceae bacterium]
MDYFAFRLFSLIVLGVVAASIVAYVIWGVSKGRKGDQPDDPDASIDL